MKLLVVIVNYRTASLTIDCLRSLAAEVPPIPGGVRVVVTDNASGDDSVNRLAAAIATTAGATGCTLLPLPRNGGFAYGNNAPSARLSRRRTSREYVLLLNPDTVVRPGAITGCWSSWTPTPTSASPAAGWRTRTARRSGRRSASTRSLSEFEARHASSGVVSKLLKRLRVAPPVPAKAMPDGLGGGGEPDRPPRSVFEESG